jgi:hypothetical protein
VYARVCKRLRLYCVSQQQQNTNTDIEQQHCICTEPFLLHG